MDYNEFYQSKIIIINVIILFIYDVVKIIKGCHLKNINGKNPPDKK